MIGKSKSGIPPTGTYAWIDVRDVALAHVRAMEVPEAANKRFFITAGFFSNKEISDIIGEKFPEMKAGLPTGDALKPGDYPEDGVFKIDNKRSVDILGLKYRGFEDCVVDTVKSLQGVGA